MVQNCAARLISNTNKYDHITPILIQLHWLPVDYRSMYKVLLITYKCLHDQAPHYLKDLLVLKPSRGLRSDNKMLLVVPPARLKTYGDRAFCVASPKLWNSLPDKIRMCESVATFKKCLKMYLFRLAYPNNI